MYRILISAMGYDGGKSGISEYIHSVTNELSKNHHIDLLILNKEVDNFPLTDITNIHLIRYPDFLAKPVINMLWHLFILPFTLNFKKYDFVFLPAGNRRLFCRYPKKTLITMHDLSQFHIEGKYDKFRTFYIKKIIPYFLKKSDKVFAISKSTRDDLVKYYGLQKREIIVNYNGFNADKFHGKTAKNINTVKDISKKYIFYVARIEHPGKNHLNLVRAYEMLTQEIRDEYDLVFAGSTWNGGETVKEYATNSFCSNNIKFLGFVKDKALPGLYRNASLYAFPSFYEGFGIPILEAMSSEVPVICSNTSSLPEVGGDAVCTFDPNNPNDIKDKIEYTLKNKDIRLKMIEKGISRAKEFSWTKHCKKIVGEYEKLS